MATPTPPKFFLRFFRWFCDPELHPYIEGDLMELYNERAKEWNKRKADRRFMIDVLKLFRPGIIRPLQIINPISTHPAMLKNYFKVAWRNLLKHKLYSFLNISGLTIGISCFLLIALYLQYELSYDAHHEKADQVYRVIQQQKGNVFRGTDLFSVTPEPLAAALQQNFPEVSVAATVNDPRYASETVILAYEDKVFSPRILYADENVFKIFTIPIIEGIGGQVLNDPNTILLSQSLARKYFGTESPIGKAMTFNKEKILTVQGVFEDLPENQHLKFDFLIPLKSHPYLESSKGRWNSNNYRTYVVLPQGYDHKLLEQKMTNSNEGMQAANARIPKGVRFILQPIRDIHLYSKANFESSANSDIRYIYLFGSIAFIILLLAAINYMNLATARSINRSKEVGMRKVFGAQKAQLITQFLGESFLLTGISFLLSILLVNALLPLFNNLLGHSIPFSTLGNQWFLLSTFLIALLIGGLSGLYPALFLSGVSPIKAIKGSFLKRFGRGNLLRNTLIVGQFAAAVVLAISSIIVYQQLQFIQNKKLGYNREQVVYVPFYFKEILDSYEIIRNELLGNPQIKQVALSNNLPIDGDNQGAVRSWEGNDGQQALFCYRHYVDYHFLDLYEIDLLEGRGFSPSHPMDSSSSYLLNESAVAAIGWTPTTAIGKVFRNGHVIGIVKDFHFQPMDLAIEPMFIMLHSPQNISGNYGNISIKIGVDHTDQTLAHIQQTLKKVAPGLPLEAHFLDDSYDRLYESERRLGQAFNIFTLLAIFIACVGLFGLISHSVVQRSKEIGIRKVLGASEKSIVQLLSKDFIRLVAIAFVLATPVAWYIMQTWLQGFAYRVAINGWIFLLTGLCALSLAFFTVSIQSFKAASANPAETLQVE